MLNKEGFLAICEPNKQDLYSWLVGEMKEYYGDDKIIAKDGFMFATGNIPCCFVAHMDTVHTETPMKFVENGNQLSSPQGIGGDDRCGIFGILCILFALMPQEMMPYLFFSTDEESGMKTTMAGAKYCAKMAEPIKFLVELDRANSNDAVYYQCGNQNFKDFINTFGFKECSGTGSDIKYLCSIWDVAGVNLSCGYYKAHTTSEYVILSELNSTVDKCIEIAKKSKEVEKFAFCEVQDKWKSDYPVQRTLYFFGDSVFVKKDGCIGCEDPRSMKNKAANVGIFIPGITSLKVEATMGSLIKVKYKGKSLWIEQDRVVLDY